MAKPIVRVQKVTTTSFKGSVKTEYFTAIGLPVTMSLAVEPKYQGHTIGGWLVNDYWSDARLYGDYRWRVWPDAQSTHVGAMRKGAEMLVSAFTPDRNYKYDADEIEVDV